MTSMPGTLVYCAPETLRRKPKYNKQVDVFSFGHLAIFAVIEEFPDDLLEAVYFEGDKPMPRSEFDRRIEYIKKVDIHIGSDHPIRKLIEECLYNIAEKRPSASTLQEQLCLLHESLPRTI